MGRLKAALIREYEDNPVKSLTLNLISDPNALSTLVSNWLIHMNWAVSISRLSQYYTKRASPEPPYLQRGIKAVYMSSV